MPPSHRVARLAVAGLLPVAVLLACDHEVPATHSLAVHEEVAEETSSPADAGPPERPQLVLPEVVTYEVKRGGAPANVANLFGVHHHEILALNPGIGLDDALAPGTKLTVYRRDLAEPSESIGSPNDGQLQGAVPMLEGPGRRITAQRYKAWATAATIAQLDRTLTAWPEREPNTHEVLVGNLSAREGGALSPHASHRSGRDVDLSYIQRWDGESEVSWQKMSAANLDCAKTWSLLQLISEQGEVERIFIDYGLQKLLYEYAVQHKTHDARELARWIEYPLPAGISGSIVTHVPGHADHIHVRYACRSDEDRCR